MKRLLSVLALLLFSSPCWATITKVQNVTNFGTSVTTATGISLTIASTGAGHLLVADCDVRDGTAAPAVSIAVSDNQTETWTTPAGGTGFGGASLYWMSSFYVLSSTTGVTSVTFKPSGGGGSPYTSMICDVVEYSTDQTGFTFDAANLLSGTTASNTESVTIVTTKANDVVYCAVQNANGDTGTALTGFTNLNVSTHNGTHQNQNQLNVSATTYTCGEDSAGIANGQGFLITALAITDSPAGGGGASVMRRR